MDWAIQYVQSYPISTRANADKDLTWLTGDLIAGITVGIVLVPQGMSYAKVRHSERYFDIAHTTIRSQLSHLNMACTRLLSVSSSTA